MPVAALATGSGIVVLPSRRGTATAQASARKERERCARQTAAREVLNLAAFW
jgi:hypothetical protein